MSLDVQHQPLPTAQVTKMLTTHQVHAVLWLLILLLQQAHQHQRLVMNLPAQLQEVDPVPEAVQHLMWG